MDAEFWLSKWNSNQIGFHQHQGNEHLQNFWQHCVSNAATTVLVPLCGKSPDLFWLSNLGHKVVGIELSERAITDFFTEHDIQPTVHETSVGMCYSAGNISIYQGDFFAHDKHIIGQCDVLYDRAALIALPSTLRNKYVAHLLTLLPHPVQGLLITLAFDYPDKPKPPFPVLDVEVKRHFAAISTLTELAQKDLREHPDNFNSADLRWAHENVYQLS
jgi:thiopurine S-methyltransferase